MVRDVAQAEYRAAPVFVARCHFLTPLLSTSRLGRVSVPDFRRHGAASSVSSGIKGSKLTSEKIRYFPQAASCTAPIGFAVASRDSGTTSLRCQ